MEREVYSYCDKTEQELESEREGKRAMHGHQNLNGLYFISPLLCVHFAKLYMVVHVLLRMCLRCRDPSLFQSERQSVDHMVVLRRAPPEWTPLHSLMPPPEVWDHVCTRDVANKTGKHAQTSVCVYVHVSVPMYVSMCVKQMGGKKEIREG